MSVDDIAGWAKKIADIDGERAELVHERDAAIRAAHAEGLTLRAIAEAAGLTHTAIAKIVAKG